MTLPAPVAVSGSSRGALALVVARATSALGSAATAFALNVALYERTGSYAIFATIAIAAALPALAFAPIAGVLVDRYPRRRILLACDASSAATIVVALAAQLADALTPWLIGGVSVALALLRTVSWPAAAASIALLAPAPRRARINGFAESLEGVVVVASPLLGALLLGATFFGVDGLTMVIVADLVSYAVCFAIVAAISFPGLPTRADSLGAGWRGFAADCATGFRFIAQRRGLLRLLAFMSLVNFGCAIFLVAYTPYVLSFATSATLATCLALGGSGTVLAGLAMAATGGLRRAEHGVLLGGLGIGAAIVAFGIARDPRWLPVFAFAYGAALPLVNASSQTLWQAKVPLALQGRVFAVRRMVAWGLNPLAVLISIPMVAALFAPLLRDGALAAALAPIFGSGTTGAIGLMLAACGTTCSVVALATLARGGLRVESADRTERAEVVTST